jgi:hypothetical protein
MATLCREADKKSRRFVSLWMPDQSLGTHAIVDQLNIRKAASSAGRSAIVTSLALVILLAAPPRPALGQTFPNDDSVAVRAVISRMPRRCGGYSPMLAQAPKRLPQLFTSRR